MIALFLFMNEAKLAVAMQISNDGKNADLKIKAQFLNIYLINLDSIYGITLYL